MLLKKITSKRGFRYLILGVIITVIYSVSLAIWDVYPFGEYIFGMVDFQNQYLPFFTYYREHLFSGDFNYTFSLGIGNDLYGLFYYYLASPLNLILFLFSVDNIHIGIYLIMLVKLVLIGITSSLYFERYNLNLMQNGFLAISYALSGYAIVNMQNPMWIDAMYIFPILLIAIDNIIEQKKYTLFIVTYAYALFTNFYMAYMMGILSILFFTYRYVLYNEFKWKDYMVSLMKYGLSAVVSALTMCMPLYLTLHSLAQGKSSVNYDDNYSAYDTIWDLFSKLYIGSNGGNQVAEGLPNIYVPTIIISLAIVFFGIKSISKKEKWLSISLVSLFILLFFIPIANYVLHGFSHPIWFLYRYSYIFSFLLLMLSARALEHIDEFKLSKKFAASLLFIYISFAGYFLHADLDYVYDFSIYVTTLLFVLDVILLYVYSNRKTKKLKRELLLTLMFISGIYQLFGNAVVSNLNIYTFTQRQTTEGYNLFKNTLQSITHSIEDEDLYRTASVFYSVKNDNMTTGTAGIVGFSSTFNARVHHIFSQLGYSKTSFSPSETEYTGGNIFSDSIFNVKYVIGHDNLNYDSYKDPMDLTDEERKDFNLLYSNVNMNKPYLKDYDKIKSFDEGQAIYQNNQAIGLGFLQKDNMNPTLSDNAFDNLNTLSNNLFGYTVFEETPFEVEITNLNKKEDIYVPIDSTKDSSIKITYTVEDDVDYYGSNALYYVDGSEELDFPHEVYSGDYNITSKPMLDINPTLLLDNDDDKGIITIKLEGSDKGISSGFKFNPAVYQLDEDLLKEHLDGIKGTFDITKHTENTVIGNVTAEEETNLVLTIPYDSFWSVSVNGSEVEPTESYNALLTIPLEKGKNNIELQFGITNTMKIVLGVITGGASILIMLIKKREQD